MKRVLGFVTVAALLAVAQNAEAVPTLTLSINQANGTALQCTALGGTYAGGDCSFSTTTGLISVFGVYGDYQTNQELAVGFPVQAQPALWLNSTNGTTSASTITIKLVANDYSNPTGAFPLLSTASGTVDEGMSVSLQSFYDVGNTGIAGAGTLLLDADWVGFSSGAVPSNSTNVVNDGDGLYSLSWVLTTTRADAGPLVAVAGINGTLTQDDTPTGVPAPGGMALLGLGMLGVGAARRYRR